ncbi:MAG: family 1 glycosylhydrolase, partial [Collinsella aerofaciens]
MLLDATFRGDYAPDTPRLSSTSARRATVQSSFDDDLSIMRRAAQLNDCLGINYYKAVFSRRSTVRQPSSQRYRRQAAGRWRVAGVGERRTPRQHPSQGPVHLMMDISLRYPNYKQLFITENGMGRKDQLVDGTVDDSERIAYVEDHLRWILKAIECGVDVGGYFMWSLQDQFSWTNGYNKRYGFFYVDYETQEGTPKASAYWFK